MKQTLVRQCNPPAGRLLIFFAGWGMDATPFADLAADGFDTMVVSDYSDPEFDLTALAAYSEICVVAWSFGVWHASRFLMDNPGLPVTLRVAVNGTNSPVDDEKGIPDAIFRGTLDGLSDATVAKFRLRMCGSRDAYSRFCASAPGRPLDSLRGELALMASARPLGPDYDALWDVVYIGASDRIFPAAAQRRAWSSHPRVVEVDSPHLPDLRAIVRAHIADKDGIAGRFRAASSTYDANASVQRRIARTLASMIPQGRYADALEVGCGTGMLTELLRGCLAPGATLRLWDLVAQFDGVTQCDAETAIRALPAGSLDLVATASTIQWFDSPERFVGECARALRPGGVLAVATFGPENYRELGAFVSRRPVYLDLEQWRGVALAYGLTVVDSAVSLEQVEFGSPADVLRHMKLTGVNSLGGGPSAARAILAGYPRESGRCVLTYNPLWLILKKLK